MFFIRRCNLRILNRKKILPLVLLVMLFQCCLFAQSKIQANLEFLSVPEIIAPGEPFEVSVHYNTNLSIWNTRFVAILQLKSKPSGEPFMKIVRDNNGRGYSEPEGKILFSGTITEEIKNVYLTAYLAPYGMNEDILRMLITYPADGTHQYLWKGGSSGFTRDLFYLDQLIGEAQKNSTTYCCGTTFEVFLRAFQKYNRVLGVKKIGDITYPEMKKVRGEWYGSTGDAEKQVVSVLVKKNLGHELEDIEKARAGDFCMFWRRNGSGHSVIFIDWLRNSAGEIEGLKYWSSQKSTNGIGYREEKFAPPKGINRNRTYIVRLKKPRDKNDWRRKYAVKKYPTPISMTNSTN